MATTTLSYGDQAARIAALPYVIEDWAGNRILPAERFATFEDAWERIYAVVAAQAIEEGWDAGMEEEALGEYGAYTAQYRD